MWMTSYTSKHASQSLSVMPFCVYNVLRHISWKFQVICRCSAYPMTAILLETFFVWSGVALEIWLESYGLRHASSFSETSLCAYTASSYEKTYLDVRVYNPYALSNKNLTPSTCHRKHECEKKWAYEQRVREVEHSSFTTFILLTTGGMGTEATCLYKHLASMLTQKWESQDSSTLCRLQCRLTFLLLCSAIQAIRGSRSTRCHAMKPPTAINLISAESNIVTNW